MPIIPLQTSFRGGMKRDYAREAMPEDTLWNIIDILPEVIDARGRKRGGWENASQAISAVTATAARIVSGIFAPYSAGDSNLAFDEDGRAYEIESATGTENIGLGVVTTSPVFYEDRVITPHLSGTSAPNQITRSGGAHTIATLAGSPPAGRYAVIYKDVLWLASPAATADRIFFSTAGNPADTWDTANKYIDMSFPITGMAALQNAVFVFGNSRTARVRGTIPPPDSDFIIDDPIFDVGCTDNRSISLYRDKVIWGNAHGLYISDGSAIEDLTRICGMKQWWMDVFTGFAQGIGTEGEYVPTTWSIVTQVYGDYLFYSVMDGTSPVDSGMIDMTRYSWIRLSNIDGKSMWRRPYPEELYFGRGQIARVGKLSSIFDPTSGNVLDGDGDMVTGSYETPYYMPRPSLKTIRRVFCTYDIRHMVEYDSSLSIGYLDSPDETTYTTLSPTLPETGEITRVHRPINKPARGIAFKVSQSQASLDTRYYDLELEVSEREGMK